MLSTKRTRLATLATVASLVATVTIASTPASAGPVEDVTKPLLQLPSQGSFLRGGTIGEMLPVPDEGVVSTSQIPMFVDWRALDESGICGYQVKPSTNYRVKWSDQPYFDTPRYDWLDDDYIDQQGGGIFNIDGYYVRAHDCAGNQRTKYVAGGPIVWQDTGESYWYGELAITYSGTWGVSNCLCWSGGTTHRTFEAGASAAFEVPAGPIGLVMETAPDRGAFELWIDGEYRRTVSTYAAEKQHRTIVWAGRIRGEGLHTVEIVNLASPGHPRIDLDAVLTH